MQVDQPDIGNQLAQNPPAGNFYAVPLTPAAHSRLQGLEQHLLQEARREMAIIAQGEARPGDPVSILPSHVVAVLGDLDIWLKIETRARAKFAMDHLPHSGELQQTVLLTVFGALFGAAMTAFATGMLLIGVILFMVSLVALMLGVIVWRRRRVPKE